MKVQKINLRVFGVLRNFSNEDGFLQIEFGAPVQVETGADLKRELMKHYSAVNSGLEPAILEDCALADESSILQPESRLKSVENLALLPPVCGG